MPLYLQNHSINLEYRTMTGTKVGLPNQLRILRRVTFTGLDLERHTRVLGQQPVFCEEIVPIALRNRLITGISDVSRAKSGTAPCT